MDVRMHDDESLEGSLLLVGFPSRGLVGGVAATYVIDDLKMRHIASIYDPRLPPTMVLRNGVGHSPIQIYSSAERCGPDGKCDKLVICQSEIPLEAKMLGDVAWAILKWAKDEGVSHVVVLEGIDAPKQSGKKPGSKNGHATGPMIRGARSISSKHELKAYNVEPWEEGLFSGYSSAFLLAANDLGVDLLALFIAARAELPDARAATLLLRSVDAMLPNIDFRTKMLDERAAKFETRMKTTLEQNKRQLEEMRRTLDMMYR